MSEIEKSEKTKYKLPFEQTWFVGAAGDTINVNHHVAEVSQQFGIDFIKIDSLSSPTLHQAEGKLLTDYFAYGAAVHSPVCGTVFHAHDGEKDNDIGICDEKAPAGNYVVIKANDEEFVFLAHFQTNSVSVTTGETIKTGHYLGNCGNSGNSTCPHIHMHVQDCGTLGKGVGKNIEFSGVDILLSGKSFSNVSWPMISGLFVSNAIES